MSSSVIYLDYNATTPVDSRVLDAMIPFFTEKFGNAASRNHAYGWEALESVDLARERIAKLLHVEPREIVFTSGATESNNLALKGLFELYRRKGQHIITAQTEHKSVLDTCYHLEKAGAEVTYLPVDEYGMIDPDELDNAIRKDTVLVSIMWANNETGVIQPMKEIGAICRDKGIIFHSDATQAVSKTDVNPKETGIHLMSFSSHKMYGPKGIGAVYISRKRPRVNISAQIDGGGHENGFRSGTLNVPGIVGFGKAADIAREEMNSDSIKLLRLRQQLESILRDQCEAVEIHGSGASRLPHVSNVAIRCVDAEGLLAACGGRLAISSGSACSSASLEPSHVLIAMHGEESVARESIRISMGKYTSEDDIRKAAGLLIEHAAKLRSNNPVWTMFKEGVDLSSNLK